MEGRVRSFGETAKGLARNPLGIIALFLVLVYGLASLVTVFGESFTASERLPLIYFLVFFPVMVLIVFTWLVSKHSFKLFAPSDFKDEEHYVKLMGVVSSLSAATAKSQNAATELKIEKIDKAVRSVEQKHAEHTVGYADWKNHILWVDDRPENNAYERKAFEAIGLRFTLALSTEDALKRMRQNKFAAIISDMGRREGPREGYVLLDTLRKEGDQTPLFFYSSSNAPEHKQETLVHGGQGCTNNAQELFNMVIDAMLKN